MRSPPANLAKPAQGKKKEMSVGGERKIAKRFQGYMLHGKKHNKKRGKEKNTWRVWEKK